MFAPANARLRISLLSYRLLTSQPLRTIQRSRFPMSTMQVESESPAKKQRVDRKVIGTHNGTFHCDEALAVFLLHLTPQYRDADVVRSRDPAALDKCDIVVDVGAVYDESKQRFDHHQREFKEIFENGFVTKLSSAGLIYKHFGKEIIQTRLNVPADDPSIDILWIKMYKEFIEAIDGVDNGVQQYPAELKPKYRSRTDLSSRVGWLNPAWNESVDSQTVDKLFQKASNLTGDEFLGRLDYYGKSWLPARHLVVEALMARTQVDSSGRIVLFEKFAPWKEHLYDIEAEFNLDDSAKPFYVLYPDETGNNWRVQAISVTPDVFQNRKSLPKAWRGLRDDVLSQASGIPGCVFVHSAGFIGGNATKDGALEMARKALNFNDED